jgi:hypothetical protein
MNPRLHLVGEQTLTQETLAQVRALGEGLKGHRDRLDAELRLMHGVIKGFEERLHRMESRIAALEVKTYLPPEAMYAIESKMQKP